jgi:hypothetical protein
LFGVGLFVLLGCAVLILEAAMTQGGITFPMMWGATGRAINHVVLFKKVGRANGALLSLYIKAH